MEDFFTNAHVAQDAAEALIALGWPIQPQDDDMDRWRIGDLIMTDEELIGRHASRDPTRQRAASIARWEIRLPLRLIAKICVFDPASWPHRRPTFFQLVAGLRQIAPDPIEVCIRAKGCHESGKPVAL